MNRESSRSHAVFTLTIQSKVKVTHSMYMYITKLTLAFFNLLNSSEFRYLPTVYGK